MIIAVYEKKELHLTAKEGILNLIPKANKDSRYVKNLRPITLLNVDYKTIEKVIADKMLPALEHIINRDQRGFMKNRRISVNIRKMLDIMHHVEHEDLETVVLSLDFVKCFDKCSFSILHGSLEYFQFGKIIKEWTKILYHDFKVRIQNNGTFSDEIKIKKGVHQGGCCSSVYFLVIAEILAIALRNNEKIEGITIAQIRNLLNQFADDMDIFSKCTKESITQIYKELDQFYYQSGFTVSYEKTTLYRIGSLRHSNAQLYNMTQYVWFSQDINVLGVTIAHEDIVYKNYKDMQQKVKETLNAWYNRGLSLIGKTQIINTLVASQFVYKMMVLPTMPNSIIKNIENEIRHYLWNGGKAKIALNILQNKKEEGGLNLVNLKNKEIALKATWPQILDTEVEYSQIVYESMKCKKLGNDIWRCSILPEDIQNLKMTNTFWKDVLKSWNEYYFSHNFRIENQYIWYNSRIRIQNKPFMWNDVYNRGLKYVYQLFEHKQLKNPKKLQEQYGLTLLRYNSLVTAIPKEWIAFFKETDVQIYLPIPPHDYDTCLYTANLSKKVYNWINSDISYIHNKYVKWHEELGEDICEDIFQYGKLHK